MITINHNVAPSGKSLVGMLLPFGYIVHSDLIKYEGDRILIADEIIGSEACFFDGVGIVIKASVIFAKSDVADTIAYQCYGYGIEQIYYKIYGNWGKKMNDKYLIYLVVKWLKSK
ncbi:MAG: hypothetical protein RR513_06485 [Muribaculaceae bacterium]